MKITVQFRDVAKKLIRFSGLRKYLYSLMLVFCAGCNPIPKPSCGSGQASFTNAAKGPITNVVVLSYGWTHDIDKGELDYGQNIMKSKIAHFLTYKLHSDIGSVLFLLVVVIIFLAFLRLRIFSPKAASPQMESSKTRWDAVSAIAAAIAAFAALLTICVMIDGTKESEEQQLNITRGTVMSQCLAEYFQIRHDAENSWQTNSSNSNVVQEIYSDRMYGLHFEEYHLFKLNLISEHVYAVWLKDLREDTLRTTNDMLPKVNFTKYLQKNSDPDFDGFISNVISIRDGGCETIECQIKDLLKKENPLDKDDPLENKNEEQ